MGGARNFFCASRRGKFGWVEEFCKSLELMLIARNWQKFGSLPRVPAQGLRTPDIYSEGTTKVGTREMGDAVVKALG